MPVRVIEGLDQVAASIAEVRDALRKQTEELVRVLQNPAATAAAESHRIGVTALEHCWFSESEQAFTEAIQRYPLRSASFLFRGICRLRLDMPADAEADFRSAVRYGEASEPEAAISAALFFAVLCDVSDPLRPNEASEMLCYVNERWPSHVVEEELTRRNVVGVEATRGSLLAEARRLLHSGGLPSPSEDLAVREFVAEARSIAVEHAKRECPGEPQHPYWQTVRALGGLERAALGWAPIVVPPRL